jgi:hypothetical protein
MVNGDDGASGMILGDWTDEARAGFGFSLGFMGEWRLKDSG